MDDIKRVRVDNWGIFFLQRLQLFFSKTDYCDLTLQFQGNVQLKVHRLVLYACTEYFQLLEHSEQCVGDNIISMPDMLQADVTVPIINFMYTGMLEYPPSIYSKLYKAASLLKMTVLTKLLDAQKQPVIKPEPITPSLPFLASNTAVTPPVKKQPVKGLLPELPPTLPGRKLPVWKRKNVMGTSKPSTRQDKIWESQATVEAAKPTRFEWPEDDLDLPPLDLMSSSDFGDISYTSKPLLIEDDVKPILQNLSDTNVKVETREVQSDAKSVHDDTQRSNAEKRKCTEISLDKTPKKIKIVESEKDTTISVFSGGSSMNFDPTKIVSEILKKYPHLMKKTKNIKLKIMAKEKDKEDLERNESPEKIVANKNVQQIQEQITSKPNSPGLPQKTTWVCKECTESNGEHMQFVLYYLYRKHMSDVHNKKFDPRVCKYCGVLFTRNDLQAYHLYTRHGIKPSDNYVFPSCTQCPYVAISKKALLIHKNKHKKTEVQCNECKLAFTSYETIATHLQITGHNLGKSRKNIFDCQYCMKTSQSAISLLTHLKSYHEMQAKKDGIVSLDEVDIEDQSCIGETIVKTEEPDTDFPVSEVRSTTNKVKIISDVKVPAVKNLERTELVAVDQNKVHTTVPTSIATSLGLLDIVVLDENQQFILQNPDEQTVESQSEYILPQIGSRNVGGESISTTDELVMVLTDQDYKDGHSAITADNSNIVVLYSHPAEGQQGQFITSQGNLMVNSETGLIEIRNGATIATTSANQIVMRDAHNNHMETIEMIQREIDGNQELKEEQFYEQHKTHLSGVIETPEAMEYIENSQIEEAVQHELHKNGEATIITAEDHVEETQETAEEGHLEDEHVGIAEETTMLEPTPHDQSTSIGENTSMESSEAPDTDKGDESTEVIVSSQEEYEMKDDSAMGNQEDTMLGTNLPFVENDESMSAIDNVPSEDCSDVMNNAREMNVDDKVSTEVPMEVEEETVQEARCEKAESQETIITEDVTEGPNRSEGPEVLRDEKAATEPEVKDGEKPYSPTDNPIDMQSEIGSNTDINEKDVDSVIEEENSTGVSQGEVERDSREVGSSQSGSQAQKLENDENSQSSQDSNPIHTDETQDNLEGSPKTSAKISILDDWDDTDSQQSDKKTKVIEPKVAQETVHKLMDDWEEDDAEK